MMVQAGAQLVSVGWITAQNGIAAHNATLDLVEPEDAAKLHRFAEFAFADNRCVRLKQADQLVAGWDTLALQYPTLGLAHDLLDLGHEVCQLVSQALRMDASASSPRRAAAWTMFIQASRAACVCCAIHRWPCGNAPFSSRPARLSSRPNTRTPSCNRVLSVGW